MGSHALFIILVNRPKATFAPGKRQAELQAHHSSALCWGQSNCPSLPSPWCVGSDVERHDLWDSDVVGPSLRRAPKGSNLFLVAPCRPLLPGSHE